jgi:hypothetical protein
MSPYPATLMTSSATTRTAYTATNLELGI